MTDTYVRCGGAGMQGCTRARATPLHPRNSFGCATDTLHGEHTHVRAAVPARPPTARTCLQNMSPPLYSGLAVPYSSPASCPQSLRPPSHPGPRSTHVCLAPLCSPIHTHVHTRRHAPTRAPHVCWLSHLSLELTSLHALFAHTHALCPPLSPPIGNRRHSRFLALVQQHPCV